VKRQYPHFYPAWLLPGGVGFNAESGPVGNFVSLSKGARPEAGWLQDVVHAKRPQRLPVILTRP
jgi:hypothetical protein